MPADVGLRVSHYRLLRQLGAGGMGQVFLAEDHRLNRRVAIKFLTSPSDEHSRRRLLREARAIAAIDHPNLCAVYEVDADPACGDFIVMQYVDGETLTAILQRGRLPATDALVLAAQIADGLSAAHRRGIIHRDLKPQNIIVTPSGTPKLLDFGLAKWSADPRDAADAVTASQVTHANVILGTPGYMSPEQVRNQPLDLRSDIFSLGCVLYECLTGRRAFAGATTPDVLAEILHTDPPSPSSVCPDLGAAHDALIARALHKTPGQRFQSADELLGSIRTLAPSTASAGGAPISMTVRSPRWSRARIVTIAAIALAVTVAWWQWREGALPAPPTEAARWYDRGVEALREGAYAGARSSFEEAIRIFPDYAQAYARLAEAESGLDDETSAQAALLHVNQLVPNRRRLSTADRLRVDAIEASLLHQHERAVDAYRRVAESLPGEAPGWVDVGRAEEAAGRLDLAQADYLTATTIDPQYAAAHLRAGMVRHSRGESTAALKEIDEAIRLFHAAANTEGETEALLRKGVALSATGQFEQAHAALTQAIEQSSDRRYLSQQLRARFEQARVTAAAGKFTDAEVLARDAATQAIEAGLQSVAANGLVDLGSALMQKGSFDAADAQLVRAIELAQERRAVQTEMRARLQQASLRLNTHQYAEAIELAETPRLFFKEGRFARSEAQADAVLSRSHENLEHYDNATRLATDTLELADAMDDQALRAISLESIAGLLTKQGRLPEALTTRERIEQIHRDQKDRTSLAYDLVNRAELLIALGRGPDAESLLVEVDRGIADGIDAYLGRRRRVALMRELRAFTEGRFADALRFAGGVRQDAPARPDSTALLATTIAEQARAHLGQSRTSVAVMTGWVKDATSPVTSREIGVRVAEILWIRHEDAAAIALVRDTLAAPPVQTNAELRWRLAAVARLAAMHAGQGQQAADLVPNALADLTSITSTWGSSATLYFARPDLVSLRAAFP